MTREVEVHGYIPGSRFFFALAGRVPRCARDLLAMLGSGKSFTCDSAYYSEKSMVTR
jgi:hypothetical protein